MDSNFFIAYPFYAVITTYIMLEDYDRALALDKKMLSIISYVANALLYYDYISWHILLHLAVLPNANKVLPVYILQPAYIWLGRNRNAP